MLPNAGISPALSELTVYQAGRHAHQHLAKKRFSMLASLLCCFFGGRCSPGTHPSPLGQQEKTQEDSGLAVKDRCLKSSDFSELFWALLLVPRGPVQSVVPQSSFLACEDGPRRLGQTLSEEPRAELADRG